MVANDPAGDTQAPPLAPSPPFQSDATRHAIAYPLAFPVIVHSRADIAGVLQRQRESLALTCLEHDDRAGFCSGYTAKLENGGTHSGKRGFHVAPDNVACSFMAEIWGESLGVVLAVIPVGLAYELGAQRAPPRAPKVHRGPSVKAKAPE